MNETAPIIRAVRLWGWGSRRGTPVPGRFRHAMAVLLLSLVSQFVVMPTAGLAADPLVSEADAQAGWISLFDGETLFGWVNRTTADWQVREGAICVSEGPVGLLHTSSQFGDFELELEFRAGAATNSGVFVHTPPQPTDPAVDCYEVNIAPADNPFPTGSIVQRQRGKTPTLDEQAWQAMRIEVSGGTVTVSVNGDEISRYVDPRPLGRGYIGLQHNTGAVAFRALRLRPLGLAPLLTGSDLEGWRTYPQMASTFSRTPSGELHVVGGRGQLETEATFADFVLQLSYRTQGPGMNSGIFFRCLPGQEMMGYESQIHHGYEAGDRTRPVDFGTGGIFRRQPARRVVGDDQVWCHKTLIAVGPHVSVWVNGHQVTAWTDTRPPDENPRRGRRLAAGTLILQGHDPTTDLLFRDLRAGELPPRHR